MEYKLIELNADGTGYAVLYFDDGTSVGQQLRGAPVGSRAALEVYLQAVAAEVAERLRDASTPEKSVALEVNALLDVKTALITEAPVLTTVDVGAVKL